MGRHTLAALLFSALTIPQLSLAMNSTQLLQCLNQSESFYNSSLYGFEKFPEYDVRHYRPNLPEGTTHYSLVTNDGFDFKVEKEFAYLDSYTNRGNVKRTIMTPEGEVTCVFPKEHLDSIRLYPKDLGRNPPRVSRIRAEALGISFNAHIECTKNKTPSDVWEKLVENYFKGINKLYADDLYYQSRAGTLSAEALKRQSGSDLLRRLDKDNLCSTLSPNLRQARAQTLTNLYSTELRYQERLGGSGGNQNNGGSGTSGSTY